jgi:transposase
MRLSAPNPEAAARFGIAVSSAIRWVRAWRVEGRVTALPQGGDLRSHHIEVYRDVILGAIALQERPPSTAAITRERRSWDKARVMPFWC